MTENNNNQPAGPANTAPGHTGLVTANQTIPALHNPSYGQVGDYTGGSYGYGPQEEEGLDLLKYWHILTKHKWLILGTTSAFLILGAAWTLMQTPLYTSKIRLQIEQVSTRVVEQGDIMEGSKKGSRREFLKTQYELIKSRMMAERVVASLNLGHNKDFLKSQGRSVLGSLKNLVIADKKTVHNTPGKKNRVAAKIVTKNRSVSPVRGSLLVDVNYTDPDPERAQKIANAYAEAFIASNIDKRFQANASAKTFLEDKIGQLKLRLQTSEKTLLEFAKKEKIVAVTNKASIADNNLSAANVTLGNLIAERIKKEQIWKQANSRGAVHLRQLVNPAINELRTKRSILVTEYQEKLQTFKPNYPVMVEISNKIKDLNRQTKREIRAIKQRLKAEYRSAAAQEKQMKGEITRLKDIALDLKQRSIQYNSLKQDVDSNRTLYNSLLQRYKQVDVAAGVSSNNIFVIDRATLPESPSSPRVIRSLLLFLVLGLGGGVAGAFGIEYLDDTIHTAEELHAISGLTTLGVIPKVKNDAMMEAEFDDPLSPMSEAYRSLATSLQLSTETGLPRTLSLTSAGPAEAKSTTAIALARHFATLGVKVLLIDADLRKASLHDKLGLPNETGLSSYLTGACEPPEAMQLTQVPNLTFMSSGPLPPNAADILGGNRLFSLLSICQESFDFIVLDGPPMLGLADAQLLSNAVSATLFITASGQARIGQVRGALTRLKMVNSPVIGTILTKFDAKAAGYGGYGYGNYGSYGGEEYLSYGHENSPAASTGQHQPREQQIPVAKEYS